MHGSREEGFITAKWSFESEQTVHKQFLRKQKTAEMLLQILLHSSKLSFCAPKALRKDCSQAFREASATPDVSNYKITIQLFSWKSCKHVWCLAGCAFHIFFCVDDGEKFSSPSFSVFQSFVIFCSGNINRSSVARWTGGDGEARIHSRAFCEFYELKVL